MTSPTPAFPPGARILIIGYGNPARGDDGLGPLLIENLRLDPPPGVTLDSDYQLAIEDAAAAAEHDVVVFVDAATTGAKPFAWSELVPRVDNSFTSHRVSPEGVLELAERCFNAAPRGYLLAVRGYEFEMFTETLSPRAMENLAAAEIFLREILPAAG